MKFSDHIVYIDESGDHGLSSINPEFPLFTLVCCVFKKDIYANDFVPKMKRLKLRWFGHDAIVLHGSEIRKSKGVFSILLNETVRTPFLTDVSQLVENAQMTIIAAVIDKNRLKQQYTTPTNPYTISLKFCLERIHYHLRACKDETNITHCLVEQRGKKEDNELVAEFDQIIAGSNYDGAKLPFALLPVSKACNSSGLQIADLVAHPISRHILSPEQPNRAYEIVSAKFRSDENGKVIGWGLKTFP